MRNLKPPKPCAVCGKEFASSQPLAKTCSNQCRAIRDKNRRPEKGPVMKPCKRCGAEFAVNGANHVYCSRECGIYSAKSLTERDVYRIYERDSFRCVYCGKSSIEHGVTLNADHIFPKAHGGKDIASNLVTSCSKCNQSKRHKMLRESIMQRVLLLAEIRNAQIEMNPDTPISL